MPPTTVISSTPRLMKMSKRSRLTEPSWADMSTPPTPAMAAESMNTDSLRRTTLMPRVAQAAGLSFMAARRRP